METLLDISIEPRPSQHGSRPSPHRKERPNSNHPTPTTTSHPRTAPLGPPEPHPEDVSNFVSPTHNQPELPPLMGTNVKTKRSHAASASLDQPATDSHIPAYTAAANASCTTAKGHSAATSRSLTANARRLEQNRLSQKAYRDRKDQYTRDLERKIAALTARFGENLIENICGAGTQVSYSQGYSVSYSHSHHHHHHHGPASRRNTPSGAASSSTRTSTFDIQQQGTDAVEDISGSSSLKERFQVLQNRVAQLETENAALRAVSTWQPPPPPPIPHPTHSQHVPVYWPDYNQFHGYEPSYPPPTSHSDHPYEYPVQQCASSFDPSQHPSATHSAQQQARWSYSNHAAPSDARTSPPVSGASATTAQVPDSTFDNISAESINSGSSKRNDAPPHETEFSACELYGETDFGTERAALEQMEGLSLECVDNFFRRLEDQYQCQERKYLQRLLVHFIRAQIAILNSCKVQDRPRAIDIMESVVGRYPDHFNAVMQASMENKQPSSVSGNAMESPVPEPNARVPVKLDAFLQAMKFVHGLSLDNRAQNSVQELCALFKNQAMCMDRSRRQLFFFKMIAVSQHLLELCPSAIDRNMLILALDIGRAQNEEHMSQWLDELETITD
ncbi:hypothetical protein HDU78_009342 [Chytriomyces hyalinus]|nr:hypothetical protein HDU78_009342 [Chytriomyces hyalinus]